MPGALEDLAAPQVVQLTAAVHNGGPEGRSAGQPAAPAAPGGEKGDERR